MSSHLLGLLIASTACGSNDGSSATTIGDTTGAASASTSSAPTPSASTSSAPTTSATTWSESTTAEDTTDPLASSGTSDTTTPTDTSNTSEAVDTEATDDTDDTDTDDTESNFLLPWVYQAAVDHGIRDDNFGLGAFQAPRKNSKHSGIDYSMPIGTPLYAPCDGVYLAGYDGGYGRWVQVVCRVPESVAGAHTVYASLLFAHLDHLAVPETGINPNNAGAVTRAQTLGTAGKSGNANVPGLNAHLHFEVALVGSELAGLQEAHISGDDSDTPAAAALRTSLAATCLEPFGFAPKFTTTHLGRRIDPFLFMTCLAGNKPALVAPKDQTLHAWSDDYKATNFDVNVGIVP